MFDLNDLKKHIILSEIKPYTEDISAPIRLKVDEARVLNGIGRAIDADPKCILQAAIRLVETLFCIDQDQFYSEVTRNRKLEMDNSVLNYKDSLRRQEAAKKGLDAVQEKLPEGYFDAFSGEVLESAEKCAENCEKIDVLSAYRKSQE